jgi:hypothetical protein
MENKIETSDSEESITALPLDNLAFARAGIEPATCVIFQAFPISKDCRQGNLGNVDVPTSDRHSTSQVAKAGVEPASSGVM